MFKFIYSLYLIFIEHWKKWEPELEGWFFPPSKRVKLNPFRHTTVHCNLTPIVLQDVNSHWLLSFWRPNEILKTNINFDATKGQNILKHYYWCGFFFFFLFIWRTLSDACCVQKSVIPTWWWRREEGSGDEYGSKKLFQKRLRQLFWDEFNWQSC